MATNPQIPTSQQSILQNEDRKIDRIWYNFFQQLATPQPLSWTTATRPSVKQGYVGYNTTTSKFEGFDGTNWINLN